jgi:hypothetical protein
MENTIPSESSAVTIDMAASQAYAEEDAATHNERGLWTPNEDRYNNLDSLLFMVKFLL